MRLTESSASFIGCLATVAVVIFLSTTVVAGWLKWYSALTIAVVVFGISWGMIKLKT